MKITSNISLYFKRNRFTNFWNSFHSHIDSMVVSLNLEWFAFSQHNFNSGIIHNSQSTTSFPFVNNPIVTCDILFLSSHSQIITILNDIVDRVLIWNWWTWETWNLVKKSTIWKRSIASAHRWTKEKKRFVQS